MKMPLRSRRTIPKNGALTSNNVTADNVYTAFQTLRRADKYAVLSRVLQDKSLREDLLDLATIASRANEPTRPLREVLRSMRRGGRKSA